MPLVVPDGTPPIDGNTAVIRQPCPEVWSNTRGGLCEALPYYRAYKGSLYSKEVCAFGFLIDKEADPRDVFSAQVIICSVGGGRELDRETGNMVRKVDAADGHAGIRALNAAKDARSLVAVIAVLDYFHITDIWKELQVQRNGNPVKVWRVRFEKAELHTSSWWAPRDAEDSNNAASSSSHISEYPSVTAFSAQSAHCIRCYQQSKVIFTIGWMCLNPNCASYFQIHSQIHGPITNAMLSSLAYTKAFLNQRDPLIGPVPLLRPLIPNLDTPGLHGTESGSRGAFVCPDCGCCSRRLFWNRLACENCSWSRPARMLPYTQADLRAEAIHLDAIATKRRLSNGVNDDVPITAHDTFAIVLNRTCIQPADTLVLGNYTAQQYLLPDAAGEVIGSFTMFVSNQNINSRQNGPDDLFRELSATDIGLKRNPAANAGTKNEGLTRHFQQNFGARYKFGVSVQSKGFDEAPTEVLRALHRLIWAGKRAVEATAVKLAGQAVGPNTPPPTSNEFNELLALGFMQKDSINYHDDGETELGPTVAALSLGSPSIMKFRPKIRKSGFGNTLPTCSSPGSKRVYKSVLEVPMKHGDMMVMHGQHIHRIYEANHAVEPFGERRFSMTSRYIDPEKMTLQADREDAAVKGAIPSHSYAFAYAGN
ncbi:hypothetical protein B0H67DRAFT_651426 [Lasiosphaeris hirsuta]|uniref:Alpha-ketoglutarate-dependent dioxygenase AlkB-like domain-containing protein n=1 Tax=Lasiosphaeris hirsuta TaxID=260670 RepID=A0AA40B912_9PEZI|nr:hypothetical protein B0H67DRAFT_651426 [Lasiosphaeris hirsuta]